MYDNRINRRQFLGNAACAATAATVGIPYIVSSSALGAAGSVAANGRITLGHIGVGNQGGSLLRSFLGKDDTQVVAICDVHSIKRDGSVGLVHDHYADRWGKADYTGCKGYNDFREVLARKDIDAVVIAPPDQWHVPMAVAAARVGKNIYLEKPIGLTINQSRVLANVVNRHGTVFQFGTQQRSDTRFRRACELVRNGRIGELRQINVWSPTSGSGGSTVPVPPPKELDYDMWLGPAPYTPYTKGRCSNVNPFFKSASKIWPFISDYCIGWIAGWGIHPLDIALWGAGAHLDGPIEVQGAGVFPTEGACNTATDWDVALRFADSGVKINFKGILARSGPVRDRWRKRYDKTGGHGTVFEGSDGWVHVKRGYIDANPKSILDSEIKPNEIGLYKSNDHVRNFLDCVKSRGKTISPIEAAVQGDTLCQISNIAILLKSKLKWDPKVERFVDNATANRMLTRPMRSPWHL